MDVPKRGDIVEVDCNSAAVWEIKSKSWFLHRQRPDFHRPSLWFPSRQFIDSITFAKNMLISNTNQPLIPLSSFQCEIASTWTEIHCTSHHLIALCNQTMMPVIQQNYIFVVHNDSPIYRQKIAKEDTHSMIRQCENIVNGWIFLKKMRHVMDINNPPKLVTESKSKPLPLGTVGHYCKVQNPSINTHLPKLLSKFIHSI